jgi:putative NADH-flavin reductase
MKIAIYGASGMIGSRVAAEAVSRGHEVTGVTRSGGELPAGVRAVQGMANDAALARGISTKVDVVVAAMGPSPSPRRWRTCAALTRPWTGRCCRRPR